MNNQPPIMNQHQVLSHSQMLNQPQVLNPQSQMLNQLGQSQLVNQQPLMNQSQMVAQSPAPPPSMVNQPKMISQGYGSWPSNMPPMNTLKFANPMVQMYGGAKPGRSNWKGKKVKDKRRKDMAIAGGNAGSMTGAAASVAGGYKPPTLHELEFQNRLKARRFYPKKKYNRMAPYAHAPRNTTSFLIRAKKCGGIASLVSPYPVTPAVLPTPVLSPSREALVDMAKEEWGVDGYGSMKGLIRLRASPGHEADMDEYEEEDDGGSSESDVEERVEVERRLDHDLSRFEMIYPNSGGVEYNNLLENRVDDHDTHIAHMEEENLILKERVYLLEREMGELRRMVLGLERQIRGVEDVNEEEVVENISENESESLRDVSGKREEVDYLHPEEEGGDYGAKEPNENGQDCSESEWKANKDSELDGERIIVEAEVENNDEMKKDEPATDLCMKEAVQEEKVTENED